MNDRLTQEQLSKIVAEVSRIADRQEMDREQVEQVLVDLNLSPDLLDEAMMQLQRREALAVQRRRTTMIALTIALAVFAVVGYFAVDQWRYGRAIAQLSTVQDRLTYTEDDGGSLTQVNRQASPEIVYRVTLSNAPVDQRLSLSCQWEAPTGDILRENRYQTRRITTPTWNTYCRHQFGTASPEGTWTVRMQLGDRILSDETFEVR